MEKWLPEQWVKELQTNLHEQTQLHQKLLSILLKENQQLATCALAELATVNQEKELCLRSIENKEQERIAWLANIADYFQGENIQKLRLQEIIPAIENDQQKASISQLHAKLLDIINNVQQIAHTVEKRNKARLIALKDSLAELHLYSSNIQMYSPSGNLTQGSPKNHINQKA